MKTKIQILLVLFGFFGFALSSGAGEDGADADALRSILETKSAHVVSVKAVIQTEMNMGGKSRNRETTSNFNGLLVDSSGIILAPRSPFRSDSREVQGQKIQINKTPKRIDVIFGPDSEEHSAFLGAKDDRFGLAFLKLENPDNVDFSALDLNTSSTPSVAQNIVTVSRLPKTFNYAPTFNTGRVNGKVNTPRDMWSLNQTPSVSLPAYSLEGKLLGIVGKVQVDARSEIQSLRGMFRLMGSGSGSNIGYFLLPIEDVRQILNRAKKQIQKQEKQSGEKTSENKEKETGAGSGSESPSDE